MAELLPEELRAEIARTLKPVRPLASPGRQAIRVLLPVAGVVIVWVVSFRGLRYNASDMGAWLWAGSALQVVVALSIFVAALAEAIPGRLSGGRSMALRVGVGLGFMLALTGITFVASPTHVPPLREHTYFRTCVTQSFSLGLVPLGVAAALLGRGLLTRPVVAGSLAGLAAGLLADSSWRLYCEVSDPSHVLTAHAGAIVSLTAIGALAGWISSWFVVEPPR
jgi:hypothetical protein